MHIESQAEMLGSFPIYLLTQIEGNKVVEVSKISTHSFEKTKIRGVSVIKMITGGDTLTVQKKYGHPFTMYPRCKLLFASNFNIKLENNDPAFLNRLVAIPCNNPIPKEKQNHNLFNLIQPEKNAIAVKALHALRDSINSGKLFKTANTRQS
jgi:putative DNA primase/helicase